MNFKKLFNFDYYLFSAVVVLLLIGVLILVDVSVSFSRNNSGGSYYFFHQVFYGILAGIFFGFIAYKLPLSFIKRGAWIFILISLILMLLVFVPKLGIISKGAPRWLNFGFFTFQPSELLKLSFIIYLSAWLSSRAKNPAVNGIKKQDWRGTLAPFLFIMGFIFLLLYFQSNASAIMLIFSVALLIYFVSGTVLWHSILAFSLGIIGFIILIVFTPYRLNRILILLGFMDDPMGLGYQIKQSLITIGSGGIFGLGLGASAQKFGFLPETMSDSIFSIFAEELGFIGASALIFIFLLFLWRGLKTAKNSPDSFSKLCAVGITSWICIQAFINMGAMINILPLTGIPLPFISYGGSHILVELIGAGILLNISKSYKR